MRYSVIIPVYNRPDEVDELLQSLTVQHFKDFEVVAVEDGSSIPCKEVTDRYTGRLDIKYFANPIRDRDRPVIMEPNAVKGNILLYSILMWFCPKDISMP